MHRNPSCIQRYSDCIFRNPQWIQRNPWYTTEILNQSSFFYMHRQWQSIHINSQEIRRILNQFIEFLNISKEFLITFVLVPSAWNEVVSLSYAQAKYFPSRGDRYFYISEDSESNYTLDIYCGIIKDFYWINPYRYFMIFHRMISDFLCFVKDALSFETFFHD